MKPRQFYIQKCPYFNYLSHFIPRYCMNNIGSHISNSTFLDIYLMYFQTLVFIVFHCNTWFCTFSLTKFNFYSIVIILFSNQCLKKASNTNNCRPLLHGGDSWPDHEFGDSVPSELNQVFGSFISKHESRLILFVLVP